MTCCCCSCGRDFSAYVSLSRDYIAPECHVVARICTTMPKNRLRQSSSALTGYERDEKLPRSGVFIAAFSNQDLALAMFRSLQNMRATTTITRGSLLVCLSASTDLVFRWTRPSCQMLLAHSNPDDGHSCKAIASDETMLRCHSCRTHLEP